MRNAHRGADDESDQRQPRHQRNDLTIAYQHMLQWISDEHGNDCQQQKLFLLEQCAHFYSPNLATSPRMYMKVANSEGCQSSVCDKRFHKIARMRTALTRK
ncbi:hypothetical protein ALO46_200086 [Pseudomonas syringae pv. solidagae]|nr:hypothetical protein ALO46_200086 [Pseudomonas syringae pv. solidagae]